jgi:hypothetical protein
MLDGAVKVVKVPVDGSKRDVGSGVSQPSHWSSLPLLRSMLWTATIGQLCSGPHWPWVTEPGTTALLAADAALVPTAFVAVTVKV